LPEEGDGGVGRAALVVDGVVRGKLLEGPVRVEERHAQRAPEDGLPLLLRGVDVQTERRWAGGKEGKRSGGEVGGIPRGSPPSIPRSQPTRLSRVSRKAAGAVGLMRDRMRERWLTEGFCEEWRD
jgi:hypothetical protein